MQQATTPRDDSSISDAIQAALEHHHAGRLAQAEAVYRQILQVVPKQPDALHLLGMIAFQRGQSNAAVDLVRKAIGIDASNADHHHDFGDVLQSQGRFEEAATCYRDALSLKPDSAETHFSLGNVLSNMGKLDDAAVSYRAALSLRPHHADTYNNLGIVLQQQGKLDDAAASYIEALSFKPDSHDLYYNLGNVLRLQGKLDEAVGYYRKALAIKPTLAPAHYNLAAVFQHQDKPGDATACYLAVLALQPDHVETHYNLGIVLQKQDRLDDAVVHLRKAVSLVPDHWAAHNALGNTLAERGQWDDARASYRKSLSINPSYAEAYNNLGNVLHRLHQPDAAIDCYRKAVSLMPDYAEAHNNLGIALNERGLVDAAIASYRRALDLRNTPEFQANFARCIGGSDLATADADVRRLVTRAISEPWARPADLARAAIKMVALDPAVGDCISRASAAWPTTPPRAQLFGASGFAALCNDTLLRAVLENAQVCELALERLLTMVRETMLDAAINTSDATVIDSDNDAALLLYCALARQCFINEYVFACTDEQLKRATRLRDRLAESIKQQTTIPALSVLAVASYMPLLSLSSADTLLHRPWPPSVLAVLRQQIAEPLEERRERNAMPRLTAVDDATSDLVRQQYEENPYPRWVNLPSAGRPASIDTYLRRHFPFASLQPLRRDGDIDILIAGCGTGQEAIETAGQIRRARVLAVDLSVSSLCYAKRKTLETGATNIEYAQADLMKLGAIGLTFDVVSSVGVLHHLAHPEAGLHALNSLLRPGGFMRLGFYSERARSSVVAARKFIAERGFGTQPSDIRRCRQEIADHRAEFGPLTSFRDFYTTSECRDLVFHVQEHRFALPQLKQMLDREQLHFAGFVLEPRALDLYRQRFPHDASMTNLDTWDRFESEFPDTFVGMYCFWVQKPSLP